VPVQDGCRVGLGPHHPASWANRRVGPQVSVYMVSISVGSAPHAALWPVRQGKKSGPAGGVQGRSIQGRVGLPAGRAGKGGLGCGLLTTRPGRYGKERRAGRQEGCKAGQYGGRVG
jgi:hypothetical protein